MKRKAQSLIEFAIILMVVTAVAILSLQIISNKINSQNEYIENSSEDNAVMEGMSAEETNCKKMGLFWDKQNGLCEAK